jgi:predicted ribosomally synthesized peptide with SipW-like signal peptide
MKKILGSLVTIGVMGALVFGATSAFFSDVETSVGNTFQAGDIDLKIDNSSYAIDYNIPGFQNPVGNFVASEHTSWQLVDLTAERFFDFIDLKPGDYGEDTISIHVGSNDAWLCAAAQITEDSDNGFTEPEDEVDAVINNADGTGDGDLDSGLQFAFWVDDGDNVLETDEYAEGTGIFLGGTLAEMGEAGQIRLADSSGSVLPDDGPVPGGSEEEVDFYVGKMWCYGTLTATPVAEGTGDNPTVATGFSCDGSGVGNIGQTDRVVGDLQFYAEQSRNNDGFLCSEWIPDFPEQQV